MLKKILLTSVFGVVITIVGAVATPTDLDRKTASSKAYVDTMVATKQLKIPAAGQPNVDAGETVMTYTANGDGEIGERGLYSDASSYDADTDGDKLITASALKDTFTNLPTTNTTKLECANQGDGCSLWTIVDQTAYTIQLPAGYTRLEYIESTGTQYITSPIKSVRNSTFYLDFQMTETPASGFPTIWGAMPGSSEYKVVFGSGTQKLYSQPGNASGHVNTIDKDLNRHQATVTLTETSETVVVDEQTYSSSFTVSADDEMPLSFFARTRYDGMNNFAKVRLYRAWHKNAGGEIDFFVVPAKNSSNVLGMYDTVSGRFFTNAATSGEDFRPGPVAQ